MEDSAGKKVNELQDGGLCVNQNVADGVGNDYSPEGLNCHTLGDKAIDFKATRMIYNRFGIKGRTLEVLSILWMYLEFTDCHEVGCTLKAVSGWSGFGSRQMERIGYRLGLLVECNAVDKIPYNGGYRYLFTQKGLFMLKCWDDNRRQIIEDIEKRAIIARLKKETTKLKRQVYLQRPKVNGKFTRQGA